MVLGRRIPALGGIVECVRNLASFFSGWRLGFGLVFGEDEFDSVNGEGARGVVFGLLHLWGGEIGSVHGGNSVWGGVGREADVGSVFRVWADADGEV
jgi:hypothetical protein